MNINLIAATILDETSSLAALRGALDAFTRLCSGITGIQPDRSFDAWAGDTLLDNGVAINPKAAAHCVADYQRSVMFIRGVYAAINALKLRFAGTQIDILYAGCGPFATLLLPLLGRFSPGELQVTLLDIHQHSLDSVELIMAHCGFDNHACRLLRKDACHYKHTGELHLIIAETMQKSLEQEPQFAVTANLAPQLLPGGIFIPERIDVSLCLADLACEKAMPDQSRQADLHRPARETRRYPLAAVFTLSPDRVSDQMHSARYNGATRQLELDPVIVEIPSIPAIAWLAPALFTHISVFERHCLADYESQLTLPRKCHELVPLTAGACYRVSYQLGNYPQFNFERLGKNWRRHLSPQEPPRHGSGEPDAPAS